MTSINRFKFSEPPKGNHFLSTQNKSNYKYKDDDFPDLTASVTNKPVTGLCIEPKNYLSYASTAVLMDVKTVENKVPPGCIQYEKYKGKPGLHVTYGDKITNNSKITHLKSTYTDLGPLVDNWNRYKSKYDEIHGEGAYAEAYYLEPIYGLDEEYTDTESDYDQDAYDSYEEYEPY